jgi:hypothetical protein
LALTVGNPNTPPSINAQNVVRLAGASGSSAIVATVNDAETPKGNALRINVTPLSGSGVFLQITGVDSNGNVTANISTTCEATTSTFNLRVTDSGGLVADATLTVTVSGKAAPTITLNGANPMGVECKTSFADPGATAADCSGPRPVTVAGRVNTNVPGSYKLTYSSANAAGNTATATRTVNVVDTVAPQLTLRPNLRLWPANHQYETLSIDDMVRNVRDGCNSALGIGKAVIEKVTSDEPDDAAGNADGRTTNDIVIGPYCKSVRVRAERNDGGNGRVYVVTLRVKDASGNTTRQNFTVSVPVSRNGPAAVQDADAVSKTSNCP